MKKTIINTLAALLLAAAPAAATNINPVPATRQSADAAAWTAVPQGPALVEMLSRQPGKPLNPRLADSPFLAMPVEGQPMLIDQPAYLERMRSARRRVIPNGTNLGGFICYNSLDRDLGFYSIPLTNSTDLGLLAQFPDLDINGFQGGAVSPRFAVFSFSNSYIQNGYYSGFTAIVDRSTWKVLGCKGDFGETYRWATDMTYDPSTNRFYGCFLNATETGYDLGFMDVDDINPAATVNTIRRIAALPSSLNGIAADGNGTLWGITSSGQLVTINRKTGEFTVKASTGFGTRYNGSLAWDQNRDILYWAICYDHGDDVRSAILAIDPQTGDFGIVNNFNNGTAQFAALFADFAANDGAPAMPSNVAVNIEGFDYEGTVTFDAPTALESGAQGSGALQGRLTVTNAETYAVAIDTTVDIEYGQTGISIPVALTAPGNYIFAVTAVNADGPSYPVSITRYVGLDHPSPVGEIATTCADGLFTASWEAVTAPLNGGYFNPAELVYNVVVRKSDERGNTVTLLETETAETSVEITVDDTTDLRAFRVSVTPVCSGVGGESTETEWRWFGHYSVPFIDTMASAGAWTTKRISGNNWRSTPSGWAIPYEWGNYNNSWLFSPAVMLTKGDVYNISVKAYSEVVLHTGRLTIGRKPSPDAMDTELSPIAIVPRATRTVSAVYICEETGVYYFGILNNTASDTWTNKPDVTFSHFSVTSVSHEAPAAPLLEVTRDPSGSLVVPVKVTLPTVTLGNGPLEGPLALSVKRNGVEVHTAEGLQPGDVVEFDDEVSTQATFTYTAFATNEVGEGAPAVVSQFIGIGVPLEPAWVRDSEPETGVATVEWSPVTLDEQGHEISADGVSYNVINVLQNAYVERGVQGSSYTFTACPPGEQEGVLFSVNAETVSGVSSTYGRYSSNGLHFVGTPANLPMRETFAKGRRLSVPWLVVNQSSAYDGFTIADMEAEEGISDANGDGQALMGFVPYGGKSCSVYTGAIDVPADVTAPALRYAVLNINFGNPDNDNENQVDVYIIGDKSSGLVDSYRLNSMPLGWNYRNIDLGLLKGEKVHILITLTTYSYTTYYLDDFCLFDRCSSDLEVGNISAPSRVEPGEQFTVYTEVINKGLQKVTAADAATLSLYRDDKLITTKAVTNLSTLQSRIISFTDKLALVDAPSAKYRAVLSFSKDKVDDNNSLETTVALRLPTIPAPTDITAGRNEDGYPRVAWTAPDLTPVYRSTVSYFESFQGYSLQHLEGFSSIDVDGNVKEVSNFPTAHGWELNYHPYLSHSGNCFLMSGACLDGAPKEDWLVSPRLSGRAQTVSFYVATIQGAHENYYVYTSTTGNNLEDFSAEPVLKGRTLSDNWEKKSIDLPEGTTYFAIVAKADDTSNLQVLMIDDVEYEGIPANSTLEPAGFRLYRDRVSVTKEPLTETEIEDLEAEIGGHYYRVTALYADGQLESAPTEEIYVFSRGMVGVDSPTATDGRVSVLPGRIEVALDGIAAVAVYDYNGRAVFRADVDRSAVIPLAPGAYILTIDGSPLRLLVK